MPNHAKAYVDEDDGTINVYVPTPDAKPYRVKDTWLCYSHDKGLYGVSPLAFRDVHEAFQREDKPLEVEDEVWATVRRAENTLKQVKQAKEQPVEVPLEDGELWDHQKTVPSAFVASGGRLLLGDAVGTGKTLSAVGTVRYLDLNRIVVVCPSSVKYQWPAEIEWSDDADTIVFEGRGEQRIPTTDHRQYVILNWAILKDHVDLLLRWDPEMVVYDEVHAVKNGWVTSGEPSQRGQAAARLGHHVTYCLGLTGTPITNRPRDLYGILNILHPGWWGSVWEFEKAFCAGHKDRYGYWTADGISHEDTLHERLNGVMLRREEQEVLDLPPRTRTILPVELHPKAERKYAKAERDFQEFVREHDPEQHRGELLAKIMALRKIASNGRIHATVQKAKELLDAGKQVVAFTYFSEEVPVIDRIEAHLEPDYEAGIIDGSVPAKRRRTLQEQFQGGDLDAMLCQVQAGGEGLNLQSASTTLHHGVTYSPFEQTQAEGRVHRAEQDSPTHHVYFFGKNTVEERILDTLMEKLAMADSALDTGETVKDELIAETRENYFDE